MENKHNLGEKTVADIKKDFTIVGRHRVHSWYAWAIVGIVFGMALGIIYVANQSAQFSASQAESIDKSPVERREPLNPLSGGQVIKFGSDGNERVGVFAPNYGRIPDAPTGLPVIVGVALAVVGVPTPLAFLGDVTGATAVVSETFASIIGTASLFSDPLIIAAGEVISTVSTVSGWANFASLAGAGPSGLPLSGTAAKRAEGTPVAVVRLPEISIPQTATKAVAAITKEAKFVLDKLSKQICQTSVSQLLQFQEDNNPIPDPKISVMQVRDRAITRINNFKTIKNGVRAAYTINLLYAVAVDGLRDMSADLFKNNIDSQKCLREDDVPKADRTAAARAQKIALRVESQLGSIAANELKITTQSQQYFHSQDEDHYVEYEASKLRPSVILPGTTQPWEATLPDSSWIGFRPGMQENGKGPVQNTIMVAVETVDLPAAPAEGYLAVLSTNKQIEVRVNGVSIYSVPPQKRGLIVPSTPTVLNIAPYLAKGKNKIAVYTVQSVGSQQRFGIDYAGYINLAPTK